MKSYTFDIEANLVVSLPGTMTVQANSFEEAMKTATEQWQQLSAEFQEVDEETVGGLAGIDLLRVSDGTQAVDVSWNHQDPVVSNQDLGALRRADRAAALH